MNRKIILFSGLLLWLGACHLPSKKSICGQANCNRHDPLLTKEERKDCSQFEMENSKLDLERWKDKRTRLEEFRKITSLKGYSCECILEKLGAFDGGYRYYLTPDSVCSVNLCINRQGYCLGHGALMISD